MKYLRKFALMLACVCLLSALVGCAAKPDKTAYDHGLELIQTMAELAGSEAYLSITTGSTSVTELLVPVQEGDFSKPAAVYAVRLGDEYLAAMAEWSEISEIPDSIKEVAKQKLIGAFASQIIAYAGAQNLAASAVCAAGKTFVDESLTESVIYLYVFDNCPSAAITFTPGEDNAVSASGLFLLYNEVDWSDEAALTAFFADMGAELSKII